MLTFPRILPAGFWMPAPVFINLIRCPHPETVRYSSTSAERSKLETRMAVKGFLGMFAYNGHSDLLQEGNRLALALRSRASHSTIFPRSGGFREGCGTMQSTIPAIVRDLREKI